MEEQEGIIQPIITKRIQGTIKDPGGLPFKLARRQHIHQINGIRTGEEYMQRYTQWYTNEKNCIKRKSVSWKKVHVFKPCNRREK